MLCARSIDFLRLSYKKALINARLSRHTCHYQYDMVIKYNFMNYLYMQKQSTAKHKLYAVQLVLFANSLFKTASCHERYLRCIVSFLRAELPKYV